ncbi:cupin domain-containing protein [Maritimibacter alkaliphilus]|uniref:cupin domain-containing protein n=1 Tax=Maritimibacter alkaliphilus TaxID=404236 RepID=UPI001C95347B|nr:cupin domain-containing protein [Maritimibacter alkaliphilus]MBY6090606.1 cupin domain-containing protein [Maritimibacter alkaliphilus]
MSETVTWLGTSYHTILDAAASGGAMSIVDSTSPEGSGPPRHVHAEEDEVFIMLTGVCEFWMAGETFTRGPGETVFIPRGTEHTFRVVEGPSRHMLVLTPAGFEGFFVEMAKGQYAIPDDMEKIVEIGAAHHLTFTGPPLGG